MQSSLYIVIYSNTIRFVYVYPHKQKSNHLPTFLKRNIFFFLIFKYDIVIRKIDLKEHSVISLFVKSPSIKKKKEEIEEFSFIFYWGVILYWV